MAAGTRSHARVHGGADACACSAAYLVGRDVGHERNPRAPIRVILEALHRTSDVARALKVHNPVALLVAAALAVGLVARGYTPTRPMASSAPPGKDARWGGQRTRLGAATAAAGRPEGATDHQPAVVVASALLPQALRQTLFRRALPQMRAVDDAPKAHARRRRLELLHGLDIGKRANTVYGPATMRVWLTVGRLAGAVALLAHLRSTAPRTGWASQAPPGAQTPKRW